MSINFTTLEQDRQLLRVESGELAFPSERGKWLSINFTTLEQDRQLLRVESGELAFPSERGKWLSINFTTLEQDRQLLRVESGELAFPSERGKWLSIPALNQKEGAHVDTLLLSFISEDEIYGMPHRRIVPSYEVVTRSFLSPEKATSRGEYSTK